MNHVLKVVQWIRKFEITEVVPLPLYQGRERNKGDLKHFMLNF